MLPSLHALPEEIGGEATEAAAAQRDNDAHDGDYHACVLQKLVAADLINS
jgi:hypothetical protein